MDNQGEVVVAIADESQESVFLKDFKVIQSENDLFLKGEIPSKCVEDICNDISFFGLNHPSDVGGMPEISGLIQSVYLLKKEDNCMILGTGEKIKYPDCDCVVLRC